MPIASLISACLLAAAPNPAQPCPATDSARDTASFRLEMRPPGPSPLADSARNTEVTAYAQVRSALFSGWDPDGGVYAGTRMGAFPQLHRVAAPLADRRQLTFFASRMAGFYVNPRAAKRNMLVSEDRGGDEDFRLSLFDLATGKSHPLACPPGRVDEILWNDSGTAFAYAHTPAGTDRWDIRMGMPPQAGAAGRDTLLLSLPGAWSPVDWSPDGASLLVEKYISASESELYTLSLAGGQVTRLLPREKPQAFASALWARLPGEAKAGAVVFASDREGEFARLYLLRLGEDVPVAISDPAPWDVEWVSASRDRRTLVYALNEDGRSRLFALTQGRKGWERARTLPGIPSGIIGAVDFRETAGPAAAAPGAGTQGGKRALQFGFTVNGPTFPGDVFTYDLAREKAVRWTESEIGGLPPGSFREPELIKYPTFDSVGGTRRLIPAWLYLPSPIAAHAPYPVLMQIHGGPEQQARPGFDAFVQYLVGRGIAVVVPNVRGSSGYGKAWLKADDGRLRMNSVRDIGALLDWIKTRPDLDAGRVAVSGRSYGGFMSLASLVAYGDRLRAGISTVGISHFPTFLANTSGYRRDLRRVEYGDERDPAMAAFLDSISPLTNRDRIKTPLLLCHGRNDPRVPFEQSERIFAALQTRSVPVWFLSFRDEGHAFRDEASQAADFRVRGGFLAKYLGLND